MSRGKEAEDKAIMKNNIQCKSIEVEADKWLWADSQEKEAEAEGETSTIMTTMTIMKEDHPTITKAPPCKFTGVADPWLWADSQVKEAEVEGETNTTMTTTEKKTTTQKKKSCTSTEEADKWPTVGTKTDQRVTKKNFTTYTTTKTAKPKSTPKSSTLTTRDPTPETPLSIQTKT